MSRYSMTEQSFTTEMSRRAGRIGSNVAAHVMSGVDLDYVFGYAIRIIWGVGIRPEAWTLIPLRSCNPGISSTGSLCVASMGQRVPSV